MNKMDDYINRQAAIKEFESLPNCYNGFSDTYDKACIIGVLEEIAPADVEPVRHGRWINDRWEDDVNYHTCNACGTEMIVTYFDDYCSNCGARMDGWL